MRNTQFSIVKALAIMLVVLSHAGISGWLFNFVFIFHVPVFFLCAGFFFHTRYLSDERTFVVRRLKGLYLPFLRWSVFFLIVHNLLFHCGLLSEHFGNAEGGVTHPFTFHQFSQHLWSIVVNMSGYDQFLGGTFWFFRALLLSSLAFLVLFKLLQRSEKFQNYKHTGWGLLIIALLLTTWKVADGLVLTGVAQGGYRELMGLAFMACGFLIKQYGVVEKLTWRIAVPSATILLLASFFFPSSMAWNPSFTEFVSLPLPAVAGFLLLVYLAGFLDKKEGFVKRSLVYVGERTLYIFAFHLLAFKVVSALQVACYGLPWEAVGSHPIVHHPSGGMIWPMLYLLAGVGLPLLWMVGYRRVASHITLTEHQLWDWSMQTIQFICRMVVLIGRTLALMVFRTCRAIWQGIKDIIDASSTKDE